MSLPRQVPSHSTSPSKSSLRRTSNPPPANRSLLPSPHFADRVQHDENEEAVAESSAGLTNLPIEFRPFFALVEDTVTKEHFHPTVHYIFADDEADIITEAACQSLAEEEDDEHQSKHPQTRPTVKEHHIILDIHRQQSGSAYEVTHAQSLSSEWQVLRTNITNAPTIGEVEGDEGLMIRIEGRGNTPPDAVGITEREGNESMEEMIERFQRRLEDIRLVMKTGEEGEEQRR